MKILYVSTSTDMGGAENSLRSLALAAKNSGHEVRIISLKPLGSVGKDMKNKGLEVVSFNLQGKYGFFENIGVLSRLIQEIKEFKPTLVHAILFRAIEFCRLAKKAFPFVLITTPHHDLSRKNYFLRLFDRALKEADNISTAESESTANFLISKQKYNKEKVCLIPNGVDFSFFKPNKERGKIEKEKIGFGDKEVVFICVARLSPEKNHQFVLENFSAVKAKNPKIGLILVGDGPENANLRRFVQNHHLEKDVIFTGEVSDVYPFLLASDVFLLASFVESLPISLFEASACGLISIVSNVGDMPLVVKHGKTGFVFNPKNSVLLQVLMAEVIEKINQYKKMGQKARKEIMEKYSPAEKKYFQLYQKIQFSRENKE